MKHWGVRAALAIGVSLALEPGLGAQGYLIWPFNGSGAGDVLGHAVAGVGDVDGDGVPDVAAGAPFADPGGIAEGGQVRVYSGASGSTLWTFAGSAPSMWLGFSVAPAGDVNGDNRDDVLVGIPGSNPGGAPGAGEARIYSGATGGILLSFSGVLAGEGVGWSVANAGDVDGDNVPDPIVGAPAANVAGFIAAGRAFVVSGASGGTIHTLQNPTGGFEFFGYSVAGVGDVSGDGVRDLFVGVPGFSPATILLLGEAFVFSGLDGSIVHTLFGGALAEVFGYAVAGPGDTNGDGVPDLLVGAPGGNPGGLPGLGFAEVYSGSTGALLVTVSGDQALDLLGWSVSGIGDVNGDGLADFLAGAPLAAPGLLPERGMVRVYSGGSGALLATVAGASAFDELGFSVSGAGDVNGDGFPDLVGGARFATIGGNAHAGQARVVSIVGIPLGAISMGVGCPGTAGISPVLATTGGLPSTGNAAFSLTLGRGLGGAPAFLFMALGASPGGVTMAGCPVYLDIANMIYGAGTITLLTGPPGVPGVGTAWRPMGIPPAPVLIGTMVHFQWSVADPGSPNGAFVFSNGLTVTVL